MTKPHQPLFIRHTPPERIQRVHVIGVAGSAMGAFACMLQEAGYEVRGSDTNIYPPMSDTLEARGIEVYLGWDASHLDWGPDWVIIGNVCRRDNPVAVAAQERGVPYASFPQALSELFLSKGSPVVITGTHGKTTTTNLTAWLLKETHPGVGLLVGGVGGNFGAPYVIGEEGAPFVVEGDEYDTAFFDKGPKFLHYRPDVALINNIEFDHADIYDDVEEIEENFERLAGLISTDKALWANGDDPRVLKVAQTAEGQVYTYGLSEGCSWRATHLVEREDGCHFMLHVPAELSAEPIPAVVPMSGQYNVSNALGAIGIAVTHYHVPLEVALRQLATFKGVQKRQELVADVDGVWVMEDYANHPTAVAETVRGLIARYPDRRVWAIYEPKSNTARRNVHQEAYRDALRVAPVIRLTRPFKKEDRFPPEERLNLDLLIEGLKADGRDAHACWEIDELVEELEHEARSGDLLLFMSSSHFEGGIQKTIQRLKERGPQG